MIPIDCLPVYEDAGFYDLEFASRDTEIPFFRSLAAEARGPVLEVACGTGRLTFPIAHDGVDITGLDISRPMLERARLRSAKEGLNIEWLEQDCRTMQPGRSFGLIFSATNAMQHLLDVESACAFLQAARRALLPGGELVIDLFNPDLAKLLRPAQERYLHKTLTDTDGQPIQVEAASHYLPDRQILHFDLHYLKNGHERLTKHVNMRVFFPQEILALCHLNGLTVQHRYGTYERGDFHAASPKQILVCAAA
ncbi:MAG TPA: class I SAM-dependent methyltransferase [Prosthecobacter sp.]